MSACSAVGPTIAPTRGEASAMSRQCWIALRVSTGMMYSSPLTPVRVSKWSTSASRPCTSDASFIFGAKTPVRPCTSVASRSAPVIFEDSGLVRTKMPTDGLCCRRWQITSAAVCRAAALACSGTESSRSTTMASGPARSALSAQSGLWAGTNSSERYGRISVAAGKAEHVLGHVVEHHLLADRGDAHQARLAKVALDVKLLAVAVAAEDAQGGISGLEAGLRRKVLGGVGLAAAVEVMVEHPGSFLAHGISRIELDQRLS